MVVAPTISVLTPSFGYAHFLTDCLASVRRQRGVVLEHIVQDGGSTDGTVELLEGRPEVRWWSEPDGGQSDALNRALARARGDWIAWLNADEFYLPGALRHLLQAAVTSGADVVYGEAVFVDARGRLRRTVPQHRFDLRSLREFGCYISTCAVLMRRSALGEAPFDTDVRRRMDWDLFVRLADQGRTFHHLRRPVGAFREHDDRVTAAPLSEFREEDARLARRHGLPVDPAERWRAARVGRWRHAALKAREGAYVRQVRDRRLRGRDLRWFATEAGAQACRELLRRDADG